MDARPTPRTDSLVNAKNNYSSLGEVLSWYEDAVHLARQLERSNAELEATVSQLKFSNEKLKDALIRSMHWICEPELSATRTALRNAGVE